MKSMLKRGATLLLSLCLILLPALASAEKNVTYSYEKYNSQQHKVIRRWEVWQGNTKLRNESSSYYENHNLNRDNKCTRCGYYAGCPHNSVIEVSSNVKTVPINGTYHAATGTKQVRCNSCGKEFTRNVEGQKEAHAFSGGRCACGFVLSEANPQTTAKPLCDHTYRDTVLSTTYEKRDQTYHTANETIQSKCSKCGDTKAGPQARTEVHTIQNGICTLCKEQIGCAHRRTKDDSVIVAAVDQRDGTHALQCLVTTTCVDCGLMISTDMTTAAQPHSYASGECTVCCATVKAPTPIKESERTLLEWVEVEETAFWSLFEEEMLTTEEGWGWEGGGTLRVGGVAATEIEEPPINGFIAPGLEHPFAVDGVYILREGEAAELYVILIDGLRTVTGEEADAASSASQDIDAQSAATAEDITDEMLVDFQVSKKSADLFPGWTSEGAVMVQESLVTGEQQGLGTVTMPSENEYSFEPLYDQLGIHVVSGDDPTLLFIADTSFAQGEIQLIETTEGDTVISIAGLYYNPADRSMNGYIKSRLPVSLGLVYYIGSETIITAEVGLDATWRGAAPEALVPARMQRVDLLDGGYHQWVPDAEGVDLPLSVPLGGAQAFWIVLPWKSGVALCETYVNIAGALFTGVPEVRALLDAHGLAPEDIVNTKDAAVLLYAALADAFGAESFSDEYSPLRVILQEFYHAGYAELTAALMDPEEGLTRQVDIATAAGSAYSRFLQLMHLLDVEAGIDTYLLLQSSIPEGTEAFWAEADAIEEIKQRDMATTDDELNAVLSALVAAKLVDETWGMDNLVTGYIGQEIHEAVEE